jgi:uncharacterized membrane protein (DUF4010 family)
MQASLLGALSLALGLGLLIGLQRERAGSVLGGIRTFPLIALLGTTAGLLANEWGSAPVLGGFLAIVVITLLAGFDRSEPGADRGQTTEVAAFLTYTVGVLLTTPYRTAAIVVGGVTAVLLYLKRPMHAFAGALTEGDLRAIMRFAIVSLIILPVLPDRTFGPYGVLNPREIWWMVVLIVSIGLGGYVGYKFLSDRAGVLLGGVLGGLASSTATTVAYARRAKDLETAAPLAGATIVIASAIAAARVVVEVFVVAPRVAPTIVLPVIALFVVLSVASLVMLRQADGAGDHMPAPGNPAEFKGPLVFGAIYAVVIVATAAARERAGEGALYAIALLSGTLDVDAVTLSTARLAAADRLSSASAARLVLVAVLANLVFKAGIVYVLGSRPLFRRVASAIGATLAIGGLLLAVWR